MDLILAICVEAEKRPKQKAIRHAQQCKYKKLYLLQISEQRVTTKNIYCWIQRAFWPSVRLIESAGDAIIILIFIFAHKHPLKWRAPWLSLPLRFLCRTSAPSSRCSSCASNPFIISLAKANHLFCSNFSLKTCLHTVLPSCFGYYGIG